MTCSNWKTTSATRIKMHMRARSFFPFLPTLQSYTRGDLRADIMAAATVTPMAIPQAMAYALMAGVHPQYGIYACMLPVIMAALWGCSRFMAAGPTNAISVVLFSTMATVSVGGATLASLPEAARMPYIFALALLCGLIHLGMGLARIGDLANYISHSVRVAFGSGLAFLIAGSQLKTALGLPGAQPSGFFPQLWLVIEHIREVNPWSLGLTALTIALILILNRAFSRHFPSILASLALATLAGMALDVRSRGVALAGTIPSIIPPLSLPAAFSLSLFRDLFMPALAIALLGAVQSLAIGKQMAGIRGTNSTAARSLSAKASPTSRPG